MKRVGNLFELIVDMDNLKRAHQNAKKGKSWYREVKMVDANPEYYLEKLQKSLIEKTYQTSEYETFIKVDTGKEREIFKLPYYPDRICQWALLQIIEPYLLKHLTRDTYSAIPGKGTHECLKNVQKAVYTDLENTKYCLKMDVQKYYPSINHSILKSKYRKIFKDQELLWLLDEIIDSTEGETGIPIGNYLSQYSGNYYLSDFDHWIKEEKQIKYYYRYMDDMVIFGEDKESLHALRVEIENKLADIELTLKSNWQVFPTAVRGVDFVGYRVFKGYTLLRKSTATAYKRCMRKIYRKGYNGQPISRSDFHSIDSYNGWMKHCDSYRLRQSYTVPVLPYREEYLKGARSK